MRAHHTSLGLYLKEFGRVHPRKSQAQRSGSRWRRWGPGAVGPGSAGPRVFPVAARGRGRPSPRLPDVMGGVGGGVRPTICRQVMRRDLGGGSL